LKLNAIKIWNIFT